MAIDKKQRFFLGVIFFGFLWGLSEASLGGWLYAAYVPHASIILTVISLVILAVARIFLPRRGSSSAIGIIAVLFKLVNTPFFACHLWAILLFGISFDISCELVPRMISGRFRLPILGLVSTYLGRALFALTITYLWRYHYWTDTGLPRVIDYIFLSGSIAAFLGALIIPVCSRIAEAARELTWPKLHPRVASTALVVGTVGILVIQRII